jgi:hypothetical protein
MISEDGWFDKCNVFGWMGSGCGDEVVRWCAMWPMWHELTFGIVYGCVAVTCRLIFFAEPTISLNPPHPASSSQTTAINPRTTMSPDTSRIEKKLSHLNRRVQAILEQVGGSDKKERQEFLKELQRDVVSKSIADQNHLLTPPPFSQALSALGSTMGYESRDC